MHWKEIIHFVIVFTSINLYGQSVIPSHNSGLYSKGFELKFDVSQETELYYTLDGSSPYPDGIRYLKSGIQIGDKKNLPPRIDNIPTTPLSGPWQLDYFKWKQPLARQDSIWIVRFAAVQNQKIVSLKVLTFLIGENWGKKHQFPVLSLVTDVDNLFSAEAGLFVPGVNYSESGWLDNYFGTGNYNLRGKKWQRSGWLEVFDASFQMRYSNPINYRIHGAVVGIFPQKSIRIYTDKNPNSAPFPFHIIVPNDSISLTRFILRNSGNDFVSTHFRDAFLHEIAAEIGLDHQKSAPTVLYINGNYWGILNVRERIDKYYLQSHFNVLETEYDMIEGTGGDVINGTNEDFLEVLITVYKEDISRDSIYQKVIAHIDLDNYIDYNIFQTFFCNMDWPGNNVKFWRPIDGKWRWIFFDGDVSMSKYEFNKDGGAKHNAIAHAIADTNNQWYNSKGATFLLRNLMKNPQFKDRFIERYTNLSQTTLHPNYLLAILEKYQSNYQQEMKFHIQRWGYPASIEIWYKEVDALKKFVLERSKNYTIHLNELKGISAK